MVMPTVPLGSSVTSGEFWKPRSGPSTVTSAPAEAVEDLDAVDGGHQEILVTVAGEVGGDDGADHAGNHRLVPYRRPSGPVDYPDRPEVPVSVPSTTSNCPLPSTSANAGLDDVCPSRVSDHTRPRRVVKDFRVSVSLAPGQYEPVPTTIPVAPSG